MIRFSAVSVSLVAALLSVAPRGQLERAVAAEPGAVTLAWHPLTADDVPAGAELAVTYLEEVQIALRGQGLAPVPIDKLLGEAMPSDVAAGETGRETLIEALRAAGSDAPLLTVSLAATAETHDFIGFANLELTGTVVEVGSGDLIARERAEPERIQTLPVNCPRDCLMRAIARAAPELAGALAEGLAPALK